MSTLLSITTSRVQIADGKFDSLRRYLRSGSSASNFPICKQATFVVSVHSDGYSNWRYSCGTASRSFTTPGGSAISYDPSYTLVTT